MPDGDGRLSVALLAVPEATPSTIYGLYDLFASVGRDWDLVVKGRPGRSLMRSEIVSAGGEPVSGANGSTIPAARAIEDCPRPDIVCVPEVLCPPDCLDTAVYESACAWLRRTYEAGSVIASVCSGALLLAQSGLLDGREATTHWGVCGTLRSRYPAVTVHESRALVATGEGQRIVTGGGGSSWHDLALYLVARFAGVEEAVRIAKLYLIEWHAHGQLPFASLSLTRQVRDPLIAACQEWIADHYAEPRPVRAMIVRSGLPERSFKRRFTQATGMSPIEYVHTLRLEEAKQILETTDTPVEAIAEEVGYEDGSFFRRLFRRKVGLAPAEYRRRFAPFRRALNGNARQ